MLSAPDGRRMRWTAGLTRLSDREIIEAVA